MRRLAARGRQDPLRRVHSGDVFGGGLSPHEDHLPPRRGRLLRLLRRQHHVPRGRAGHRANPRRQEPPLQLVSRHFRIKHRIEQALDVGGRDPEDRLLPRDQAFSRHVPRDPEGGARRALAGTALQHVQTPFFYGEFQVLHVAEVTLQEGPHPLHLPVNRRQALLHLPDRHRCADACDHVLPLRIHQHVAVQGLLSRVGIARKAHPRARRRPEVAEHHLHDADRRARKPGDALDATVGDRLLRHP